MSSPSESFAAGPNSATPLPTSSGPANTSAATVFNLELALKRCCDDPDMLREMVACFLCEVDSLFPQRRAALQKGDLVTVGRLGHRMKGTVVYLGADAAREAALAAEHFERHPGNDTDAEQAVNAL